MDGVNNSTNYLPPLIYSLLSIFVLTSLIFIFNAYVWHLKVETSVVSAPMETIVAPVTGFISDIFTGQGAHVTKGEPLLKIEDIDLEKQLALTKIELDEAKLNLHYLQNLLVNEQQRLREYNKISAHRIIATQASVATAKQEKINAKHHLERLRILHDKRYITETMWEEALAKYKLAESAMISATVQMSIAQQTLATVKNGLYFTGVKLEGAETDIHSQIEIAEKKIILNENKIQIYKKLINKLILTAPYPGKITRLAKTIGNTTERGKAILILERDQENKQIIAYLTQNEISHVGLTTVVKIYIPSLGKTYHGSVTNIDRTDGFIDEIKAQYRWRDFQIDRSAMVTITLSPQEQAKFNKEIFAGAPAIVYFPRKFTVL